jgi:hypothetical protein
LLDLLLLFLLLFCACVQFIFLHFFSIFLHFFSIFLISPSFLLIFSPFSSFSPHFLNFFSPPDTVGSFCLSESGSGSDAFALRCAAVPSGDGGWQCGSVAGWESENLAVAGWQWGGGSGKKMG